MNKALIFVAVWAFAVSQVKSDLDGYHSFDSSVITPIAESGEVDNSFWNSKAQCSLKEQVNRKPNKNIAKNIIMFLGDGMSIPTLTATRIYKWQRAQQKMGEDTFLSFEEFPFVGLSRTYCVDTQVADSACSATAYLGGVKGNIGTIGVNGRVKKQDCDASLLPSNRVDSIAAWAQKAGKSAGLVTTARVTHASPAGTFTYIADRDWEADSDVMRDGKDPKKCEDIAKQLITRSPGKDFNVILGGGRKNFLPKNDPVLGKGVRKDGVNLIKTWMTDKAARNASYAFVIDRHGLLSLEEVPDYLLGLFTESHLAYNLEADQNQPTLEEMTAEAIEVLQKNKKGYFLFVEGAKIDMAHHESRAQMSLDETIEFAKAIERAVKMTNESDTLIVVTADHAHTMSMSGYAPRRESIFGFGGMAADAKPYSILTYANGMGYKVVNGGRPDMSKDNREHFKYVFPSAAPLSHETHGGDDVAVFARGPYSHIFSGSYEQNYIPHAMAYAACIGDGLKACDEQ
ncbi:UNVERIFIED_CONTAM: hypothetical protein PYX00_002998 [Menopon gallinae]|uniref:Alkaline phosphatase n=1 Tax=Menopon gallinae TaxID=328185 RepID=A0AAW2I0H5_9NEOP